MVDPVIVNGVDVTDFVDRAAESLASLLLYLGYNGSARPDHEQMRQVYRIVEYKTRELYKQGSYNLQGVAQFGS